MPNWWDDATPTAAPAPATASSGANWWTSGDGTTAPAPPDGPAPWRRYGAMAMRGLGALVGAGAGTLVAPGVGTLAGGAIGGGLGEWGAQMLEGRQHIAPLEVATQMAIGAVPVEGAGLFKTLLKSGAMGAAGNAAYTLDQPGSDLGDVARSAGTGALVGGAAGGLAHTFLGSIGAKATGRTPRAVLREEAAAATTLPRHMPGQEEIAAMRAGGGPGAEPPPPGTPPGPLSQRDQLLGIDPERVAPAVERPPSRAWWAPQVRQPSNVTDVGEAGSAQPWFDPRTAARQTPQLRQPNRVVDRLPLNAPEPLTMGEPRPTQTPQVRQPSNVTDLPASGTPEPFDIAPAQLATKKGRGVQPPPPTPVPAVPAAPAPRSTIIDPADPTFGISEQDLAEEALHRTAGKRMIDRIMLRAGVPGKTELPNVQVNAPNDVTIAMAPAHAAETTAAAAPAMTEAEINAARVAHSQATGKPFVPSELMTAWQGLKPRWAEDTAATGRNLNEDLVPFAKRVLGTENPRKLMGTERKALAQAKSAGKPILPGAEDIRPGQPAYPSSPAVTADAGAFPDVPTDDQLHRLYADESGSVDPELARRLGLHAASGAAGGAIGAATSDDEHRLRNTLGGAVVGAAAPSIFSKGGAEMLGKARYFSMLGSTSAQAKNIVGNAGSAVVRAGEEALTGHTDTAKSILSSVFSRDTVDRMVEAFKHADVPGDTRWGQTSGAAGVPSRIMHAVDEGATNAMERGGLSNDEARLSLFTSQPRSRAGQAITSLGQSMPAVVPFSRTATNIVERGLEHTPGLGMIPAVRAMRGDALNRVIARQAMGALAASTGAAIGSDDPYIGAAMGPLALPFAMGAAGRRAFEHKGDPLSNVVGSEAELIGSALPLPNDASAYSPSRYLASYVPSWLKDASIDDPRVFDTSHGLFDPAIAKIPYLNATLLRRKPKKAATQ